MWTGAQQHCALQNFIAQILGQMQYNKMSKIKKEKNNGHTFD